jgi:hypothetical protein
MEWPTCCQVKTVAGRCNFMSGRKVAAADTGIYLLSCPNPGKPVLAPLPGAECAGHD